MGYLDDNGLRHFWGKIKELIESSGVSSFKGRTGAVTPKSGDYTAAQVGAVPTGRTVNGHALSSNISLTAEDVGAVPSSRTVNGKPLSADITLAASDVGALASGGTATAATKLATSRTIRTNLASTSAASFNGTANVTPGVTGILPIANGGTGASTAAGALANLGVSATDVIETFHAKTTTFNSDGTVTETDAAGNTLKATFNTNGTVTLKYTPKSGTAITRTIKFTSTGVTET